MTTKHPPSGQGALAALVAAEVRAELGRRDMSWAELARRLGVSEGWTSRRLRVQGAIPFAMDDLDRIAEVLGIEPVELIPSGGDARVRNISRYVEAAERHATANERTAGHRPPSRPDVAGLRRTRRIDVQSDDTLVSLSAA